MDPLENLETSESKALQVQLESLVPGGREVIPVYQVSPDPQACPESRERGANEEKLVLKENRDLKVMKETLETEGTLVKQERQGPKERSVALVSRANEVRREAGVSQASRDRPVHPDREACRATGVYQGPEDPRGRRARSQVISTSSKSVCESCKNSWLS